MARADRERWNRRYADRFARQAYEWTPTRWLAELGARLDPPRPGARALDLACGYGRNALWLAERGWQVDAWDLSDVGLNRLRAELAARAQAGRPLAVAPRQVDLDEATLPAEMYDLVLNVLFLDRRLFRDMAAALRPGGLLVFETFVDLPGGRQSEVSPAHLLQPGELRQAFEALGLAIAEYDEDRVRGTARLLARRGRRPRDGQTGGAEAGG